MNLESIIAAARDAGASGIWLLNDCAPFVIFDETATLDEEELEQRSAFVGLSEFEATMQADDAVEQRALDLREAGRILIIHLPRLDTATAHGLTTLQSEAGYCRACGCSWMNACHGEDGPCRWVEADLCNHCTPEAK